jgi:vacuolar-type H+-ATPase subunit E/Vma4
MKGADNKLAAIDDATDEELERAREKVKRKVELACASGHQPAAMFSLCQ